MKKVLVVSSINGIAGRNGLTGIFDFVNEGHDWSIRCDGDLKKQERI